MGCPASQPVQEPDGDRIARIIEKYEEGTDKEDIVPNLRQIGEILGLSKVVIKIQYFKHMVGFPCGASCDNADILL
jgi:hypothetical protein